MTIADGGCKRDPSSMPDTTAPQAQPVDGRQFPSKAKGARPVYFDDRGATDAVVAIVTALASEVWALRERLATMESLLDRAGILERSAIESHEPSDGEEMVRSDEASAFMGRVFRVFEEMREEALSGETQADYLALVQRAFDEL